jgi:uncharacterized protein (TIGR02246 family)
MLQTDVDASAVAADMLARVEQAWNNADGAAFGALFTEDSDFVDIRGGHHRGAGAIGDGHQAIFDTIYAGSTVSYELDMARPLAAGQVLAIGYSTLEAPTGPLAGTNHSRMTFVLVPDGDAWKLTAFHNTLVR